LRNQVGTEGTEWTPEIGKELDKAFKRRWELENYRTQRRLALRTLGGRCAKCGDSNLARLELHHVRYAQGSVRDGHARARVMEALKHPERFKLLCRKCHDEAEPGKYSQFAGSYRRHREPREFVIHYLPGIGPVGGRVDWSFDGRRRR
jgi:5-methylcytosine-specific restriction endonuclease McrA